MEKVEYKKIKKGLILLSLQEILNKKKSFKRSSLKNKEGTYPPYLYLIKITRN